MDIIDHITDIHNLPFTVSLAVMVAISLLEGVARLFGVRISSILNNFIEDLYSDGKTGDSKIDADPSNLQSNYPRRKNFNSLLQLLAGLGDGHGSGIGLLVVFLTVFGVIGLGVQTISFELFNLFLPAIVAIATTFMFSIPLVLLLGHRISKALPVVNTSGDFAELLVGVTAKITAGETTTGNPARAKLRDEIGHFHQVMVEPESDDTFNVGDSVILLKKTGRGFIARRNHNPTLED